MKNVRALTVRFDLNNIRDHDVWEHLHHTGKTVFRTCSNAVIEELDRFHNMLDDDSRMEEMISKSVKAAIRDEFARILSPEENEYSESSGNVSENKTYSKPFDPDEIEIVTDRDFHPEPGAVYETVTLDRYIDGGLFD